MPPADSGNWLPIVAVIAVIVIGIAYLVKLVRARIRFWAPHVVKVQEGGYVPPQPYFLTALLMRCLCIVLGFLEVGPIRILGRNRLPEHGPTIIAPFHIDAGDGSIVSSLLGVKPMYYLIRTTEVVGLRGWIATLTGAIAVDEETQEGRSKAFKAAINALANGGPDVCMVIFPQGQLVPDQEVRRSDFKSGTMAIAKLAARKRKEPIWIVPIGMHYRKDKEESTLFQKIVQGLGFKHFRNLFGTQNYGAFAVVGRPFKVTPKTADLEELARGLSLDDDADKATDAYVQRLVILQKAAKKRSLARRKNKQGKSGDS
jgi:hypothetical protein